MRDYYIVSVVVGGYVYKSWPMPLEDAELAVKTFKMAAENTNPQIIFDHSA